MKKSTPARAAALLAGLAVAPAVSAAHAQEALPALSVAELHAGGELESYLRYLQARGEVPLHPWSVRAFGPVEARRLLPGDAGHPWGHRLPARAAAPERLELTALPVRAAMTWNSAFPHGINNGPLWMGRGLTTSVGAGVHGRAGPLSLVLAPVAFRAQNASFPLAENEYSGPQAFADPIRPGAIDLPQRFGDEPYTRFDWGQSTLSLDLLGVAAGFSTANAYWGPASSFPLILGNNAPGFPHVFLGSAAPWNLGPFQGHGRLIWGRLEQTPYATTSPDSTVRFATGLAGSLGVRWLPGLEVGMARFFHIPWTESGIGLQHIYTPLETFAKLDFDRFGREVHSFIATNQIASVFLRWVLPESGFEVYGEFAREDNSHNVRDFLVQPDNNSGYMMGARKAWPASEQGMWAVRGEVMRTTMSHLRRSRRQEPFYIHGTTRQGHTHRGQLLGSPAGYGGEGGELAVDRYHPDGRWTVRWSRLLRAQRQTFLDAERVELTDLNVVHNLGVESLLVRGRYDVTVGLAAVYEFNRHFADDVFNLQATLGVAYRP